MEIVRRGYELFAADDLDAVAALFASDAELGGELGRTGISDDASTGPQRFLRAVAYAREHFDDYRIKTGQFLDADDAVIVGMRISYVRPRHGREEQGAARSPVEAARRADRPRVRRICGLGGRPNPTGPRRGADRLVRTADCGELLNSG
jgi:SnoaL-like domain